MTPVWPVDLNKFERDGWQVQLQESRRKRSPDAGPPGYRRRFSSVARLVGFSIVLSRNEKAIFDRFYEEDCNWGTNLFRMPDPTTDGWPALTSSGAPIILPDGRRMLLAKSWVCHWGDQPPLESVHGQTQFRKSFNVVVMP